VVFLHFREKVLRDKVFAASGLSQAFKGIAFFVI
jgi:hypothetical protein